MRVAERYPEVDNKLSTFRTWDALSRAEMKFRVRAAELFPEVAKFLPLFPEVGTFVQTFRTWELDKFLSNATNISRAETGQRIRFAKMLP